MRPQVFSLSANSTTLLRQALPVLVQSHNYNKPTLFPTAPNRVSLLRSTPTPNSNSNNSQTTPLRYNCGLPKHGDRLLFTVTTTTTSLRKFSSRATHVNDPGSIDLPLMQSMEKKIKEQLNAESVTVKDAYGDGRHVRYAITRFEVNRNWHRSWDVKAKAAKKKLLEKNIDVVSTAFEGQSAVNRQRMVYKAIWEELQTTVHAVDQMTTNTPAEAAARSDK